MQGERKTEEIKKEKERRREGDEDGGNKTQRRV